MPRSGTLGRSPIVSRSPFAPALIAVLAVLAALARWAWQGSGNLYTALDKRFYVPDPDLGWRVSPEQPVWLGLEICAVMLVIAVGLGIGGVLLRRLERRRAKPLRALRVAAWIVAVAPWSVSIVAFASGGAPSGARESLPALQAVALDSGIHGALDAPRGTYSVIAHAGTVVTAKLAAGGEAFEARFVGATGELVFDPRHLAQAVRGEVRVSAASVDTGIGERSKHARDGYLLAGTYPHVIFSIENLAAASQDGLDRVAFRARGKLQLIGKTHELDVIGTLSRADGPALARLGLAGVVLVVRAEFSLAIRDTALAPDASDFDTDRIPIQLTLIMNHTGDRSK